MELGVNIFIFIKNLILEILFPSVCLGCQKKGEIICDYCLSQIRLAERESESNIIALYDYRDPLIKKVIWDLKYYHHFYIGKKLGKTLYNELLEDISDLSIYTKGQPILVIPVPISSDKSKSRGYNQAYKIASGFCDEGNPETFEINNHIVTKKINTIPQAQINNRNRRLKNVEGVFDIKNKEIIKGRTIIIIDDVTTTGGTIKEIMKILKKAGASKVVGFTVAH